MNAEEALFRAIYNCEFFVRDRAYDGDIHTFIYNPAVVDFIFKDHKEEDINYELSMIEFGEEPSSSCGLFRKLILEEGFIKAASSNHIFPLQIIMRFAVAWALPFAKAFDKDIKHGLTFPNGKPITVVRLLVKALQLMKKYNSPNFDVEAHLEKYTSDDELGSEESEGIVRTALELYEYVNKYVTKTKEASQEQLTIYYGTIHIAIKLLNAAGWWAQAGHITGYVTEKDEIYSDIREATDDIADIRLIYWKAQRKIKSSGEVAAEQESSWMKLVSDTSKISFRYRREL